MRGDRPLLVQKLAMCLRLCLLCLNRQRQGPRRTILSDISKLSAFMFAFDRCIQIMSCLVFQTRHPQLLLSMQLADFWSAKWDLSRRMPQ